MPPIPRHRDLAAGAAIAACIAVLWTLPGASFAQENGPTKAVAVPAGGSGATGENAAAGDECAAEIAAIRKLYKTIPNDFRGLGRKRLDEVARTVVECRDRLEAYLANCKGKADCDAHYMLARLRTSMAVRQRLQWLQKDKIPAKEVTARMREYHLRNIEYCDTTLACLGDGDEDRLRRCEVKDLKADIAFQAHQFELALSNYLAVLKECPDFPDAGNTIVGAGRSYLELRRTDEGIRFIRKAIKERYRDHSLPFFYEVLWNLLETAGDLDGMIAWCKEVQQVFPIRMLRDGNTRIEREAYRRFLGYSGFRLGYTRFARGDLSGATDAFLRHIDAMDKLEAELEAGRKALPQELKIYRQRSQDVLQMIRDRVGDPPGCDLDLEDLWVTPARVRLADSKGKAVVLLFRGYGDSRSAGFYRNLDRYLGEHPDNKAFAVIHYLKGSRDPLGQLEKVQNEAIELGIENAAVGLDPDARGKQVFRCLGAMVGSATCMIYDRNGRLMWWMQDPREMDSKLVIKIWERLAGE